MSDRTQQLLNRVLSIITLAGVVFAVAKVVILIPRDIDELKASDVFIRAEMREMRELKRQDHDLLQRIDERMQAVQERMRMVQDEVGQINRKIDRAN